MEDTHSVLVQVEIVDIIVQSPDESRCDTVGTLHTQIRRTEKVLATFRKYRMATTMVRTMVRSLRSGSTYKGWSSNSYGCSGRWHNSNRNKITADRRETRSKRNKINVKVESDDGSVADDESTGTTPRVTRNSTICCTNYGRRCKVLYPYHFFCSQCDNWEISVDTGTEWKHVLKGLKNFENFHNFEIF